ncbi:MAG: shikimate dehydrogenase [Actinobacteria bacterium]|nr:shikimate dehydrogenase [Actinomycetota bacterium]
MTNALTGATKVAGIIGDPVSHSRSPAIWNAAFTEADIDWVFVAFAVPGGQAGNAVAGARALGLAALTVTMPHKADAASACDELSDTASRLGAVNAIVQRDGRLVGHSTDGPGFVQSVRDAGVDPGAKSALVLGAGGAGRAIALALGEAGAKVVVAARREAAAEDAAALVPGGRAVVFDAIDAELESAQLVVNATPIGMNGKATPLDVQRLDADACVADTVYHPRETPLLAAARARGLKCVDGLGMLVRQAALSFESFTGVEAPLAVMRAAAETGG